MSSSLFCYLFKEGEVVQEKGVLRGLCRFTGGLWFRTSPCVVLAVSEQADGQARRRTARLGAGPRHAARGLTGRVLEVLAGFLPRWQWCWGLEVTCSHSSRCVFSVVLEKQSIFMYKDV